MRAKNVTYERYVFRGSNSHEKYGIEIELEDGDTAEDAMITAKKFVERQLHQPNAEQRAIAARVNHFDADDFLF